MRNVLLSIIAVILLTFAGGLGFIYSGFYDIAATDPHLPIVRWAMELARTRSIEVHARGIAVPPRLDDPAKILIGTDHFAAHCAVCHGAPGVPKGEIAEGL